MDSKAVVLVFLLVSGSGTVSEGKYDTILLIFII